MNEFFAKDVNECTTACVREKIARLCSKHATIAT
jgi:hypothetical protein